RALISMLPWTAALAILLSALCASADSGDMASVRLEFRAALTHAAAGEAAPVDSDSLKAYVLYPYLLAARLQQQLKSAPGAATDAAVQAYLSQYSVLPV